MKPAICCRCGKKLHGQVLDDATDVTCFSCNEKHPRKRDTDVRKKSDTSQGSR